MSTLAPARRASIDAFSPVADDAHVYDRALAHAKVRNPFLAGETVIIPKGTPIRTTQASARRKVAGRTYSVRLQSEFYGHVDLFDDKGVAHLPVITWAGAHGYWHDAQVTPELAAANGKTLADFVMTEEEAAALGLPVLPSWDKGYTDAWTA